MHAYLEVFLFFCISRCLDFKTLEWRQLPSPPIRKTGRSCQTVWSAKLWGDIAIFFVGHSDFVWVFDLVNEKWFKKTTKMKAGQDWPYKGDLVHEYCAEVLEDTLYVFGGDDGNTNLGTNILLALDLTTFVWDHISGTSDHVPRAFEPNVRRHAHMWAVPEQRRLYVLYGEAGLLVALLNRKKLMLFEEALKSGSIFVIR